MAIIDYKRSHFKHFSTFYTHNLPCMSWNPVCTHWRKKKQVSMLCNNLAGIDMWSKLWRILSAKYKFLQKKESTIVVNYIYNCVCVSVHANQMMIWKDIPLNESFLVEKLNRKVRICNSRKMCGCKVNTGENIYTDLIRSLPPPAFRRVILIIIVSLLYTGFTCIHFHHLCKYTARPCHSGRGSQTRPDTGAILASSSDAS